MTDCIALLRGINVGRAKRISMADLRGVFVDLGHENVRTVLNSGNVLFQCARPSAARLALSIQAAITDSCGFSTSVTVLTAAKLASIVRANPLQSVAKDSSRHFVAFVANPKSLAPLNALAAKARAPDILAIGADAAYLWCAGGALDSTLFQAFARHAGGSVTARNWATVLKVLAASQTLGLDVGCRRLVVSRPRTVRP